MNNQSGLNNLLQQAGLQAMRCYNRAVTEIRMIDTGDLVCELSQSEIISLGDDGALGFDMRQDCESIFRHNCTDLLRSADV